MGSLIHPLHGALQAVPIHYGISILKVSEKDGHPLLRRPRMLKGAIGSEHIIQNVPALNKGKLCIMHERLCFLRNHPSQDLINRREESDRSPPLLQLCSVSSFGNKSNQSIIERWHRIKRTCTNHSRHNI